MSKWFLKTPSDDAEYRLFCFPYSGCGASMFLKWPSRLGAVEVLPLQLPGRENRMREPHYGTYEELAVDVVDGIAGYLDRPYGVFGHCGGALPAFETVLRIQELGLRPPARCFVSSQVAPQDGPHGRFLGLSEDGLRAELSGLFGELGSADPPAEMVDMFLEVMTADLEANRRYVKPEAGRAPCPLTVVGWEHDHEVPHELMGGWARWAEADKVVLPGTHYTFLGAPAELMERLRSGLVAG
ncbi:MULTISPECIES: thioesterase II family protein [unclassified Streptomyces]|uniref:thioesterase II family protein n=1 Tax=unclassified Streptomyces TaxID=2593676 RepID=UPI0037F48050